MKYIDAEKLKAEIERRIAAYQKNFDKADNKIARLSTDGRIASLKEISQFITSLQQEQPEVDLVAELEHHLATTPKEQLEKEWKELEPWCNIGPTVQEFLYGKQPKVDFEEEWEKFEDWVESYNQSDYPTCYEPKQIARHFYELGLNARKED